MRSQTPSKTAKSIRSKTIGFKTTPELVERLRASAAEANRTLSHEVETRLLNSYAEAGMLGGPTLYTLFQAMVSIARSQSAFAGKDWLADAATFEKVAAEWDGLTRRLLHPEGQ